MATQPEETDAFEDAFAQFSTRKDGQDAVTSQDDHSDDKPDPDPDDTAGDAAAGGEGDDAAAGDGDGDDAGAEGAGEGNEGGDEGDDGVSDANSQDADDVLQRLAGLLKDAPAKDAEPTAEVQPEEGALPEIYTEEEKTFLKTYDEDWADVAKGESLKRKAEYRELMQYMFAEVSKHLGPMAEMVNELATRTHLGDLQERVPDYNDLRDNVVEWVETQPAYLQVGMKEVMKTGTADEVADLINRYRKETGKAAPAAPATKQNKAELSDDAKQAAKALAPVSTKRSVIPQDDGASDFDSAFAKFAGTVSNR